jgi:hypothetical protein
VGITTGPRVPDLARSYSGKTPSETPGPRSLSLSSISPAGLPCPQDKALGVWGGAGEVGGSQLSGAQFGGLRAAPFFSVAASPTSQSGPSRGVTWEEANSFTLWGPPSTGGTSSCCRQGLSNTALWGSSQQSGHPGVCFSQPCACCASCTCMTVCPRIYPPRRWAGLGEVWQAGGLLVLGTQLFCRPHTAH